MFVEGKTYQATIYSDKHYHMVMADKETYNERYVDAWACHSGAYYYF